MGFGLHVFVYLFDNPVCAYQKRGAHRAHILAANKLLFAPYAVFFHYFLFFIGKQRERKAVFCGELSMAFNRIDAYTEHRDAKLRKIRQRSLYSTRLLGAAARIVLGVEIQKHALARVICEIMDRAV